MGQVGDGGTSVALTHKAGKLGEAGRLQDGSWCEWLDSAPAFALNGEVPRILSKQMNALSRQALERERAEVKAKLDTSWERAKALDDKIAAAISAGLRHDDLLQRLELLRRRSEKLAERGAAIDLEISEAAVVDNGIPGARWRPPAAEHF